MPSKFSKLENFFKNAQSISYFSIQVIKMYGVKDNNTEEYTIEFRVLFSVYNKISNKLVGLLLRTRKYGFVEFQGEVLFQGRDDNVIIKLLHTVQK